jgi:hypothetical protein
MIASSFDGLTIEGTFDVVEPSGVRNLQLHPSFWLVLNVG